MNILVFKSLKKFVFYYFNNLLFEKELLVNVIEDFFIFKKFQSINSINNKYFHA